MSGTLTTEGSITRTELSLSPLAITPAGGYYIQRSGFGPGETLWRRAEAESPYVRGKYQTHAVKDQETSTLKIRVEDVSEAGVYSRMDTLAKAFEQFSYTLTITIGGQAFVYECDCADYSIGDAGNVDDLWIRSNTQIMTFQIPHKPIDAGFV